MTDRILKKIGTYCAQPDFQPEIIGRVSLAAKSLCMWVRAMEVYGRIYRVVEPKKQRLAQATSQLQEKQAVLADAKAKLKEVGHPGVFITTWIQFLVVVGEHSRPVETIVSDKQLHSLNRKWLKGYSGAFPMLRQLPKIEPRPSTIAGTLSVTHIKRYQSLQQ